MRLLKLSANVGTFRTIEFNRTGLSFIIAEQRAPKTNRTKTYNGVGKTLLLALINFCLGSSPPTAFKTHLKGWIFYLEVEINERRRVIARSADEPSNIWLDGKKTSLTELKRILQQACFEIPSDSQYLTFRSLVGHFLRFGRGAYTDYRYTSVEEKKSEYALMLRNAFLLGLDCELAKKKYDLRKQQVKLEETMKQLDSDPLFSELLADDAVDMELLALREQADRLEKDLANFRVAENYHDIELEAEAARRDLDRLRREVVKLEEAISQIDRSLRTKADLPADRVYSLYEEAKAKLPEAVIKSINEVLAFQESLKSKRIFRLTQDRQRLERDLQDIREQLRAGSEVLDEKLRYLGEHRALDEYLAVSAELNELQTKISHLENSKSIRERALVRQREIKRDLAEENINTAAYLDSAKQLIGEALATFRSYARRMYGTRRSGLVITSDDGENQQRYKIEAHIEMDAAEGINEARIFCYDLMILVLGRGHRMNFLAHDSTLFGPVDPRQSLAMLQVAGDVATSMGLQYIATLNEHDITKITTQVQLREGEYEALFGGNNVVLRLSDEKSEKKLLGVNVDMNYLED